MSQGTSPRYELVDTLPGFVIVERASPSGRSRCYFCAEATPPKQAYREGTEEWYFKEAAQSLQFAVRDTVTGEVARYTELLGLLYYACLDPGSPLRRIGEIAHTVGVSIYIAITYDAPDGTPCEVSATKLEWLNRAFNDRLRTPLRDRKAGVQRSDHARLQFDQHDRGERFRRLGTQERTT
jgi:hypothetical protein